MEISGVRGGVIYVELLDSINKNLNKLVISNNSKHSILIL